MPSARERVLAPYRVVGASLDDKRVERRAAESDREDEGDGFFTDHAHGLFPCSVVVESARRGKAERNHRAGLRTIWIKLRNNQT